MERNLTRGQAGHIMAQGEDDAAQFEEIFMQMQKQMESESKNDSSEMGSHHSQLMRNIMGQMGLS